MAYLCVIAHLDDGHKNWNCCPIVTLQHFKLLTTDIDAQQINVRKPSGLLKRRQGPTCY